MPVMADIEDDKSKLTFSIVGNYSKTSNPIRVKDKTFTFKTGSVGIQGVVDLDQYGEFYLQYGIGRSPSEEATFASAIVNGPIDINSYGFGYIYPHDIVNTPWSVDFKINKTINKHNGDNLTGFRYDKPVTANVDATSSFVRSSIGFNYQMNNDVILTAGVGMNNWQISAKAKGTFNNSPGVRFSTDTDANGVDPFYFIESLFSIMDRDFNIGIQRSNLTTDSDNILNEVYAKVSLGF